VAAGRGSVWLAVVGKTAVHLRAQGLANDLLKEAAAAAESAAAQAAAGPLPLTQTASLGPESRRDQPQEASAAAFAAAMDW
jgi:hypothetical protein